MVRIELSTKIEPNLSSTVKRYIGNLKQSLNHAIALSLRCDPDSAKSQYVRAIFLVKGVKFYGFHSQYSPFLKIMLVDPRLMNHVAAILHSGSVLSHRFQVYESHLSFILQFMCDFGLYGCGSIEIRDVYRRRGLEEDEEAMTDPEVTFETSPYPRQTRMPLELDIISPSILNRTKLVERRLHHTLAIPGQERPTEPLVTSVRELWEDERNRRRARGLNLTPEVPFDPSEASRSSSSCWTAEAYWWDEFRRRLEKESPLREEGSINDPSGWENQVMSVFESTEALWEARHRTWKPRSTGDDTDVRDYRTGQDNLVHLPFDDFPDGGEVDVNEALLDTEATNRFRYTEDADVESDEGEETDEKENEEVEEEEEEEEGIGEEDSHEVGNLEGGKTQDDNTSALSPW